ncbi:reverse transcriptase domain-containing protein [Uliginosibacterium sp. H3]|uniref:RNA-directed DNA polymerase n=1 Tax=Uliginosibacterium silvisoli TaxID=3114758 RepID=A0ABU6K4V9_9RHOO|nr:reverse transcriptase domain-containing protein [Uliginosibacterium sp. H3]
MTPTPIRELFDAVYHGKYQFDDFASCSVIENYEQVAWQKRVIYKPSKKLKAYHAFLNSFLFEHIPINEKVVFSYRKGANPHLALLPHAKSRAFYQTDLTKFFDSITSPLIRRTIIGNATPIADLAQYIDRIIELTTINECLPIGFSTSPSISNACLKEFDDSLEQQCNDSGLIYSRYADDIIISAQDRQQIKDIEALLEKLLLAKLGPEFTINKSKSKTTTVGRKINALGLVILPSGQISVAMEIKKKIEHQLHFYIKDKARLLEIFNNDMDLGLQQLAGHISHINTADPKYLEKLRRKYGTTVIDSFLHRSVK